MRNFFTRNGHDLIDSIFKKLEEYFNKECFQLVFIFGSFACGRVAQESDIDLAILFNKKPEIEKIIKISSDIPEITNRKADIVILNDASPIIKMQVLKNGKILKKQSDRIYSDFFIKTIKEYDDLKRIRKEAEKNILKGRIYA